MLTIRNEQLTALAKARRQVFVERLVGMVSDHWPERTAALKPEGLRRVVEIGIDRAAIHGIRSAADVARYLNLIMALGQSFDRDERYPWARAILEDEAIAPRHKLRRMTELAREVLAARGEGGDAF